MNFNLKKIVKQPILILIIINIVVGVFIHRDYGLTWDEPYFYSYGDALGYAYSPSEWFSGNFDLYNSYGVSGDDHKTRGPAYLFLARNVVYAVETLGSDSASAWHLVNFLFFQLGTYFLYRISKRWMKESAAFFTAVFFSYQPLLWGHAFINPKDPPFLTFFLTSVCLGFEMVDSISLNTKNKTRKMFLAAFLLGIATSIRVLGPLAGLLIFIYFLSKKKSVMNLSAWRLFIPYGVIAIVVMFITWPYLWENPILNFIGVFRFMSDNPTQLSVLFGGVAYHAGDLPRLYFPFMLTTTLTEPAIPLFIIGMVLGYWKLIRNRPVDKDLQRDQIVSLSLVLSWFVILAAYVLIRRPSMYDGIRHFLFVLPPVFIFIGLAFEFFMEQMNKWVKHPMWLHVSLGLFLILPGIYGIIKLHPYEYAYYNFYIGGTNRAFRNYETDYWLTCYKDAVQELDHRVNTPVNLFVKREAYVAAPYANKNIQILDLRDETDQVKSGDYVLINSRLNDDLHTFPSAPIVIEIRRVGATFCIIRQIP
jgi:hypothetical protein